MFLFWEIDFILGLCVFGISLFLFVRDREYVFLWLASLVLSSAAYSLYSSQWSGPTFSIPGIPLAIRMLFAYLLALSVVLKARSHERGAILTLWSDVFWFASTVSLGLVAYAGLRAYRGLGDRFYLILAIAFAISTFHSVISRILFQQFQLDFSAPSGIERIAQVLRFEYLSSGEMILVLIGLLLHVFQSREPRSAVSGVPPIKDGI